MPREKDSAAIIAADEKLASRGRCRSTADVIGSTAICNIVQREWNTVKTLEPTGAFQSSLCPSSDNTVDSHPETRQTKSAKRMQCLV